MLIYIDKIKLHVRFLFEPIQSGLTCLSLDPKLFWAHSLGWFIWTSNFLSWLNNFFICQDLNLRWVVFKFERKFIINLTWVTFLKLIILKKKKLIDQFVKNLQKYDPQDYESYMSNIKTNLDTV